MIKISVGDKVELKSDGQLYIVEEKEGRDQFSIRNYYHEATKQIDVTSNDIFIVTSNEASQNEENYDDDSAIEMERKIESRSKFREFRKKFFEIPIEILYDPFYFCLIPNITVLIMWIFSFNLVVMSCFTVMFCSLPLIYLNPLWCLFWQTFLPWFVFMLQANCKLSGIRKHRLSCKLSFKSRFVQVTINTTVITFLSMAFEVPLSSRWPIIFTPLIFGTYIFVSIALILPLMEYFLKSVRENETESIDDEKIKRKKDIKIVFLSSILHFMQLYMIKFWIWGPPNILRVMGHNHGSFLIVFSLLKISNYGFLQINSIVVNWITNPEGVFLETQFRCLFLAAFSEVLVLSNVREYKLIAYICFRFFFDFCETIFHATDKRTHILKMFGYDVTTQPVETFIHQRSAYICASVVVESIVPLYFCIAILIFLAFGQNEQILFLGTHEFDTLLSSFVGPRILIIIMSFFHIFLNHQIVNKISSENNVPITLDGIYLVENYFGTVFLTPILLLGYLLITCRFFTA